MRGSLSNLFHIKYTQDNLNSTDNPPKVMFHDEKGGEPRENVTNIPKKSGWEQANQRDKGRENVYKMGESYHREEVEKYQEKDLEKGVREKVRLYFSFPFFPC